MSSEDQTDTSASNEEDKALSTVNQKRRVHFPTDESQLLRVSMAPEPLANQPLFSLGVTLQRYRAACQRLQIRPLNSLLDQLNTIDDQRKSFQDRLDSLKLQHEKLDVKHLDAIEEIFSRCRFYTLDLDSSIYDDFTLIQFFDMIEYYESCIHLNLSNHRSINMQGYQALARYLRRTRYLQRLDMNSIRFDDTSMLGFGRALRLSSTLYELHVESCQLNGRILQKFIQNIRNCPCLRELYLCDNRLQVHDSLLINELIRSCGQFIHVLDLRSNSLQDTGMSHIASQLSQYDEQHRHESVLCKISFQSNQLTQQGVAFLAKCLLHNRTLRSLDLSHNNLNNEGLFLLRDALLTNRTVNELILRDCRLTDQAAIALAEFIAESTAIQYIDLRENNIQASGLCGIAIAIKTNQSLLKLDLDPILSSNSNSYLPATGNGDRPTTNSTSLLSLSNLRRMTVGFGSFSVQTATNAEAANPSAELIEQKTQWMEDIRAICQRNSLLYESQLHEFHDQPSTPVKNGIDHDDEHAASPNDILLEESTADVSDFSTDIATIVTNGDQSKFSLEDESDDVVTPTNEVAQSTTALSPMNGDSERQSESSAEAENGLELPTAATPNDPLAVEPTISNASELTSNGDEHDTSQTDAIRVKDNGGGDDDDDDDKKRKIHHSDSLFLLRKKAHNESYPNNSDESTIASLIESTQSSLEDT